MKQRILKPLAILLAVCMLLPLAACGGNEAGDGSQNPGETTAPVTAEDIFNALKNGVQYDAKLTDRSASAATTYMDMPENATIKMFSTTARYADELTWVKLSDKADKAAAKDSVIAHVEQKSKHFHNYQTDQLPKLENYILWEDDLNIILCITADTETAKALIKDPSKAQTPAPTEHQDKPTEPLPTDPAPTEPAPTVPPEPTEPTEPTPTEKPLNPQGYPAIYSEDESWKDIGAAWLIDTTAYEKYNYAPSLAQKYASILSRLAKELEGEANVYSMVIPTAIGVVFPDNLKDKYSGYLEDQGTRIQQIYAMMEGVTPINCYENLMQHRDEYIYYRTDWHWTGLGAYYAYESFCEVKGFTPYTLDQRPKSEFPGFVGGFYSWCGKPPALKENPDTVFAWHPYSGSASMVYTSFDGNRYSWPIIANVTNYAADGKYMCFAAGDQPIAEFKNPAVTDGSVAIVIKESFGNAMMSYLVDHYSVIYEIDYRHWEGDLAEFARQVGADDIIFTNNLGAIRDSNRIGELEFIIPKES